MKKGLVSPPQPVFAYVACAESGFNILGSELGPFIVQVEDAANIFTVGSPFYWVDVPDETVAYQWYYSTGSSTALTLEPATYYATESIEEYGAALGDTILVSPPTNPQPAGTTTQAPPEPAGGQLLFWFNGEWVSSFFDPNIYSTVISAQAYLNQQTNVIAAGAVDYQSSIYSAAQLIQGDLATLPTLDYSGYSIGAYQTFIDGGVASQEAIVNAMTTMEELYSFNPGSLNTNPEA